MIVVMGFVPAIFSHPLEARLVPTTEIGIPPPLPDETGECWVISAALGYADIASAAILAEPIGCGAAGMTPASALSRHCPLLASEQGGEQALAAAE
jgi:hypothetical protein